MYGLSPLCIFPGCKFDFTYYVNIHGDSKLFLQNKRVDSTHREEN